MFGKCKSYEEFAEKAKTRGVEKICIYHAPELNTGKHSTREPEHYGVTSSEA